VSGALRNNFIPPALTPHQPGISREVFMGRYLLLWLLGIPLPILVLIYAFGGLR
jgi:hypothetical protein